MIEILILLAALMLGAYRIICRTLVAWEVTALVRYIEANW